MNFDAVILQKTGILYDIPAETAAEEREGRTWTIQQELGHLIDSAMNNHIRIVHAALNGHYTGPTYDADGWVALGNYSEMPWTVVVALWRDLNMQLARVILRIPPDRLDSPCTIGDNPPVTLRFLIEDYGAHMLHHINQILTQ